MYYATPLIKELHWLNVRNRIMYLYAPERTGLRSASDITRLTEHRILPRNLASAANAMFEFAAPRQWNSLPATLRTSGSLHTFKKGFKTYLFPH